MYFMLITNIFTNNYVSLLTTKHYHTCYEPVAILDFHNWNLMKSSKSSSEINMKSSKIHAQNSKVVDLPGKSNHTVFSNWDIKFLAIEIKILHGAVATFDLLLMSSCANEWMKYAERPQFYFTVKEDSALLLSYVSWTIDLLTTEESCSLQRLQTWWQRCKLTMNSGHLL